LVSSLGNELEGLNGYCKVPFVNSLLDAFGVARAAIQEKCGFPQCSRFNSVWWITAFFDRGVESIMPEFSNCAVPTLMVVVTAFHRNRETYRRYRAKGWYPLTPPEATKKPAVAISHAGIELV
jgi:hypothetical protein